jgi:hypothetical protein
LEGTHEARDGLLGAGVLGAVAAVEEEFEGVLEAGLDLAELPGGEDA